MERIIVKVQLIPGDSDRAIVTDEKRRYVLEVTATEPLRARMGDKQVGYFLANIISGAVDLLEVATSQSW